MWLVYNTYIYNSCFQYYGVDAPTVTGHCANHHNDIAFWPTDDSLATPAPRCLSFHAVNFYDIIRQSSCNYCVCHASSSTCRFHSMNYSTQDLLSICYIIPICCMRSPGVSCWMDYASWTYCAKNCRLEVTKLTDDKQKVMKWSKYRPDTPYVHHLSTMADWSRLDRWLDSHQPRSIILIRILY